MLDLQKIAKEVYNTKTNTEIEELFKKIILELIIDDKYHRSLCNKLQREYDNLYCITIDKLMEVYNQEIH